jgi:hypothetical protein
MSNDKDFKVKNGIQPTAYYEGLGTVVSGGVGYDLAGAVYDGVSFSTSSQGFNNASPAFKPDGTKLYVITTTTDTVHQYTLSTAWDLSTASYDSKSFTVTQDTSPNFAVFSGDGTKMYSGGQTNSTLYQYTLSTAWDVNTASYDSVSFSVSAQGLDPRSVVFTNNGSTMIVLSGSGDAVFEYSLSTAYDLSTASYTSKTFSVTTQANNPWGLDFNADGSKMYVGDLTTDSIYQYSLSTLYDITTASYDSLSFSTGSQDSLAFGFIFGNSGENMYVAGTTGDSVYQYSTVLNTASLDLSTGSVFEVTPTSDIQVTLSNPADSGTVSGATLLLDGVSATTYDLANAVYDNVIFSVAARETIPNGIFFKPDGIRMFVSGRNGNDVNQYDLSTAWDISTASYSGVGANAIAPSLRNLFSNLMAQWYT